MNISEAARNRAFGPAPTPGGHLKPPSYRNPEERFKRFQSKGRQRPATNYYSKHESGREGGVYRGPSGGYRPTDSGGRVPFGSVKGA